MPEMFSFSNIEYEYYENHSPNIEIYYAKSGILFLQPYKMEHCFLNLEHCSTT